MANMDGEGRRLVDDQAAELLTWLHRLLMAHRYDLAQGEQLEILCQTTPGAEAYYETNDPALRPPAIGAVQALLNLSAAEVREALALGFAVGRAAGGESDGAEPAEVRALALIERLGWGDLMRDNLSYGYVLTEAATAALEATVAA
jgi:hypothetical protein